MYLPTYLPTFLLSDLPKSSRYKGVGPGHWREAAGADGSERGVGVEQSGTVSGSRGPQQHRPALVALHGGAGTGFGLLPTPDWRTCWLSYVECLLFQQWQQAEEEETTWPFF